MLLGMVTCPLLLILEISNLFTLLLVSCDLDICISLENLSSLLSLLSLLQFIISLFIQNVYYFHRTEYEVAPQIRTFYDGIIFKV